jgi:hypothetical protein
MTVRFKDSLTGKGFKDQNIAIWKEGHVVYVSGPNDNLKFAIPNSVYDNINFYCKK